MDSQGKAKVALTFALYQGDQLVRRDTIAQDIVKVGKDPRSHLRVDDELASRMHAVIEVASPHGHHAHRSGQRAGHAGQRPARQQVQGPPGRPDPDRLDAHRARERGAGDGRAAVAVAAAYARGRLRAGCRRRGPPPPSAPGSGPRPNPFAGANPFAAAPPRGQPVRGRESLRGAAGGLRTRRRPFARALRAVRRAGRAAQARDDDGPRDRAADGRRRAGFTYSMVKSGPDVSPDEVEVAHLSAIEVMVLWDSNVAARLPPHAAALLLRGRGARRQGRVRLLHPERDARDDARAHRRVARRRRVARHPAALARLRGHPRPGQGQPRGPHLVGPRASVDGDERRARVRAPGRREGAHGARRQRARLPGQRGQRRQARPRRLPRDDRAGGVPLHGPLVPPAHGPRRGRSRSSCRACAATTARPSTAIRS